MRYTANDFLEDIKRINKASVALGLSLFLDREEKEKLGDVISILEGANISSEETDRAAYQVAMEEIKNTL
jgi:hypothetical protein